MNSGGSKRERENKNNYKLYGKINLYTKMRGDTLILLGSLVNNIYMVAII